MGTNIHPVIIFFMFFQYLWGVGDAAADALRLIESYGASSSSFKMNLYWPESRAQELEARLLFRPSSNADKQYVIQPRGAWFNYFGSNDDQHVYTLKIDPFPAIPFGGQGDLIIEVFARGKTIAPLVLRFWVSGDRGVTLVTPATLRAILIP